jgi:hypothetical protein
MACSICREAGHTKPRCPVLKNDKEERERFITETAILAVPDLLANPLIVAFLWYTFSSVNPAANSANKVIVGAELIPALDLGLPPGVMLGAIMQETDDFIVYWNKAKKLFNLDILPDLPPLPKGPGITGAETGVQLAKEFQKFVVVMTGVISGLFRV